MMPEMNWPQAGLVELCSSTDAPRRPAPEHLTRLARERFFDRALSEPGATARQSQRNGATFRIVRWRRDREERDESEERRDHEHHREHADEHQRRREQLAQCLLQALRDVVDVVGDAAEEVAARLGVDVAQRKPVQLVLDIGTQAPHRSLDHAREQVGLRVRERRRRDVEPGDEQQRAMQRTEVDACSPFLTAQTLEDDVGGVAEDARPHDRQADAHDREQHDEHRALALRAEAPDEPARGALEVLGPLDRHAH
jgi:hypothetical protein